MTTACVVSGDLGLAAAFPLLFKDLLAVPPIVGTFLGKSLLAVGRIVLTVVLALLGTRILRCHAELAGRPRTGEQFRMLPPPLLVPPLAAPDEPVRNQQKAEDDVPAEDEHVGECQPDRKPDNGEGVAPPVHALGVA